MLVDVVCVIAIFMKAQTLNKVLYINTHIFYHLLWSKTHSSSVFTNADTWMSEFLIHFNAKFIFEVQRGLQFKNINIWSNEEFTIDVWKLFWFNAIYSTGYPHIITVIQVSISTTFMSFLSSTFLPNLKHKVFQKSK